MISDPSFMQSILHSLFYTLAFILSIFLAFYIPGRVILGKISKNTAWNFEKLIISLVVGMVLWAYQAIIFGYLGIRWLSYGYLLFFIFFWIRQQNAHTFFSTLKRKFINIKPNWLLLLVFIVGIFGQTQQFFITGLTLSDGIRIFSPASDDAFWHLALTSEIVRRIPPIEPGLAGVLVHNYHYWGNVVIGEIIRVFHLSLLQAQFQNMYIFVSFILGGIAYSLAKKLNFSKTGITLFVYMQYFSSDIIYLLTVITRKAFIFTVHPLEDGTMFLENPPRAFAAIVAFCGLIFLVDWLKDKRFKTGLMVAILFGSVIGFKVHTGIPIIGGLAILSIYFLIIRQWRMLIIPIITAIISFVIYFPVNGNSGLPFIAPFEMSRMFSAQTNLFLSHLELARRIYQDHRNFFGELRMDTLMLVIFLIAQFGLRNVGFVPAKATLRQFGSKIIIFLYAVIAVAIICGTFLYQSVAGADIFNFYLTANLFLSVLAAYTLSHWFDKRKKTMKIVFIILLLAVSLPRWFYKTEPAVAQYVMPSNPVISKRELAAMEYVRRYTNENDIVLVFNQGQWDSMFPYVSAFTERDMYLSGQVILGRHGISFQDRAEIVKRIQNSDNINEVRKLINSSHINILYFYGKPVFNKGLVGLRMRIIFQNSNNTIYKVD